MYVALQLAASSIAPAKLNDHNAYVYNYSVIEMSIKQNFEHFVKYDSEVSEEEGSSQSEAAHALADQSDGNTRLID